MISKNGLWKKWCRQEEINVTKMRTYQEIRGQKLKLVDKKQLE